MRKKGIWSRLMVIAASSLLNLGCSAQRGQQRAMGWDIFQEGTAQGRVFDTRRTFLEQLLGLQQHSPGSRIVRRGQHMITDQIDRHRIFIALQ